MHRWTSYLAALALAAVGLVDRTEAQSFGVTEIAGGLPRMTDLTAPPGDFSRFVVAQQAGVVMLFKDSVLQSTPFLDISSLTVGLGERGLLGLAFHPDYATNRKFYVSYTNLAGDSVIRQYLRHPTNPDIIDPTSFTTIFGPLPQPFSNHNGGCIRFGPDGKLYYAMGDGGDASTAQDPNQLLGKLLRLDVDLPFPHVPADNPFFGDPGTHDLIWASGLRNPWRITFDRLTGDLWIGDVGEADREELNFQPSSSTGGENYGWPCMEGTLCTGTPGCVCHSAGLVPPVHEYPTGSGPEGFNCAIIAGFVYRGSGMQSLYGHYLFSDWCSGNLWTFVPGPDGQPSGPVVNRKASFGVPFGFTAIGEDASGELYVLGGSIWRLQENCAPQVTSYCQTAPNSNGPGAVLTSSGSTSVGANDFHLISTGAKRNQFGLFYYGPNQVQIPFGDGYRCIGGGGLGIFRLNPVVMTNDLGVAQRQVDFTASPASGGTGWIQSGSTWNFQHWYRDPVGPGGSGFNFSDAISVTFCP